MGYPPVMKYKFLSAKEFRQTIFQSLDDVAQNLTTYVLTKNGDPQAIVLSITELEALCETNDVLSDPALMKQIRAYRRGGKTVPWTAVKAKL